MFLHLMDSSFFLSFFFFLFLFFFFFFFFFLIREKTSYPMYPLYTQRLKNSSPVNAECTLLLKSLDMFLSK